MTGKDARAVTAGGEGDGVRYVGSGRKRKAAGGASGRRWSDDPWSALTTGEGDAWRAGYEAARAQAVAIAQPPQGRLMVAADYDAREMVADAIAAMEPPT